MEKHTVPQNIMDIEFKLFGSLTIKQFGYVSTSFVICLILYFSGLPEIVSLPLIFIVVVLSLALAFLKVNEQPFVTWFSNFILSTFSSQRKVYKREGAIPTYLQASRSQQKSSLAVKPKLDRTQLVNMRLSAKPLELERQALNKNLNEPKDIFDQETSMVIGKYFQKSQNAPVLAPTSQSANQSVSGELPSNPAPSSDQIIAQKVTRKLSQATVNKIAQSTG